MTAPLRLNEAHRDQSELYPNPAVDRVELSYNANFDKELSLRIIDMTGRNTYINKQTEVAEGLNVLSFDLREVPSGIYLLEINNGEEIVTKKFMVTK